MRMNGSWHIYRPGERWQRPARDMRIVIGTDDYVAVGFNVPVAEFHRAAPRSHASGACGSSGRTCSDRPSIADEALRRIRGLRPADAIADILLNQRVAAGIGNVFKSEMLFAGAASLQSLRNGCRSRRRYV